jgi:hypothetical protein
MIMADLTMVSSLEHKPALREASTAQHISSKVREVREDIVQDVALVSHTVSCQLRF